MRGLFAALSVVLLLGAAPLPAAAEERSVTGTIVRLDPAGGVLTVRDGAGASWSYKVETDAGIDLSGFRPGDRVKVTIGRATPLNMITAADPLRKGDRVEKVPY
jgi:hypothetical protein